MIDQTDMQSGKATEPLATIDPETLLADYVAVCNQAIDEHRDKFWFRQAVRLNDKLWHQANFRAIVYDRNPGDVVGEGILYFNMNPPELALLPAGDYQIAFTWKVPLDYLADVVYRRTDWYLENPLRLDWGWLKERVRDEARYRADVPSLATGFVAGAVAGLLLAVQRKKKADRKLRYLREELNRLSDYEPD